MEALECVISDNHQEGVFVSGRSSRGLLQGNEISKNGSKVLLFFFAVSIHTCVCVCVCVGGWVYVCMCVYIYI